MAFISKMELTHFVLLRVFRAIRGSFFCYEKAIHEIH
jgi:hypothetical protein